ncbi:MAG TPA: GNAT family N-acetyltransferase [Blastocatellia bacterium]|nr:GNAT family N-acetyltransferase [Blastocatellia bacterium]
MKILETQRLRLRQFTTDDAAFIFVLLNDPAFLQNIGDKGVRSVADARDYLANGPLASYAEFGFGLWAVETKESAVLLGMCGLLKRETLEDVDIGFAFLPQFRGQGYAVEAALAVRDYARDVLQLPRLVAITLPTNHGSMRVLEQIGMQFEKRVRLTADAEELLLYAGNASAALANDAPLPQT